MSTLSPVIERTLGRASSWWKRLRLLQHSATLGALACLGLLLLGGGRILGWWGVGFAGVGCVLLALGTSLAWLLIALVVGVTAPERQRLARALERTHPLLRDRLNTLVYLEGERIGPAGRTLARRIDRQAGAVLRQEVPTRPFSAARPLAHLLAFLAVLVATMAFYRHFDPLRPPPAVPPAPAAPAAEPPLAMPAPEDVVEPEAPWGEVRIIEPGRNLTVTRADAVPMQIEAAAGRPLESVSWSAAVNGGEEIEHPLPPPAEPLYADYRPVLRAEELGLDNWDVLTYYAQARTRDGASYRSDVYFLEVQPFREEMEASPQGAALRDELTALIEQQQDFIRQTYRSQTLPDDPTGRRQADLDRVAAGESDLAEAARHAAASIAGALEDEAAGEPVGHLDRAKTELESAAAALREGSLPDSLKRERAALAELVTARKQFQETLAAGPDALREEEQPAPEGALKQIAEFRDEAQAAQDFVQQAQARQGDLLKKIDARPPRTPSPDLADEEEHLRRSLEEFRKQHPRAFRDAETPCAGACEALGQAAQALRKPSPAGRPGRADASQAGEALATLREALQEGAHRQQFADAYRLKKLLDAQIQRLAQIEQDPDAATPQQRQQAADAAQDVARQLKEMAEDSSTRQDFGPELAEALSDPAMSELQKECAGLGPGQGTGAAKQAAGAVKGRLQEIAAAFDASRPRALAGRPKPPGEEEAAREALDRGLRQLESLKRNRQDGRRLAPGDEAKQKDEALRDLRAGLFGLYGENQRTRDLVLLLERRLRDPADPTGAEGYDDLMRAVEARRSEVGSVREAEEPKAPAATHIDPARLPPAYRQTIEHYFQKLSEGR